jgi:hypothetical protein
VKWLLTTPAGADIESLRREVEAAGAKLEDRDPIPLDQDEQVLHAEGPDDLHERLAESKVPVRANPNSPMELF